MTDFIKSKEGQWQILVVIRIRKWQIFTNNKESKWQIFLVKEGKLLYTDF